MPKIDLKKLGQPESGATDPRGWRIVDAEGVLGRLAVKIADVLRGRDKATFTPHLDTGDFVIVINADKVRVTGNKETDKEYQRYSGYRGGLKRIPLAEMRERHPDRLILSAVKGMLPKNKLGASCSPSSKYMPAASTRTLFKNPNP